MPEAHAVQTLPRTPPARPPVSRLAQGLSSALCTASCAHYPRRATGTARAYGGNDVFVDTTRSSRNPNAIFAMAAILAGHDVLAHLGTRVAYGHPLNSMARAVRRRLPPARRRFPGALQSSWPNGRQGARPAKPRPRADLGEWHTGAEVSAPGASYAGGLHAEVDKSGPESTGSVAGTTSDRRLPKRPWPWQSERSGAHFVPRTEQGITRVVRPGHPQSDPFAHCPPAPYVPEQRRPRTGCGRPRARSGLWP